MKGFKKIIPIYLFLLVIAVSCSDDDGMAVNEVDSPTAALLIFPENNTVCNEGTVVSETETDVLFQWEEGTNTNSYVLQIENLNEGTSREISTLSTEFLIRILRGTPYSWSVRSISADGNETADSAVWRFYNAGLPIENHAPFPATAVNPQSGSSLEEGNVMLEWQTSDIDNDIASYTVLLETANPPVTELTTTSTTTTEASVSSGLVYYWQIITTDEVGNASTSQVFQFIVN
jgi:hypothetical protein